MEKVIAYSIGIVYASVCADKSLTPKEVEETFNREHPSGTMNGWKLSEDKTFMDGGNNPCPCNQYSNRIHYLFEC